MGHRFAQDHLGELRVAELQRRDIDGHRQLVARRRAASAPCRAGRCAAPARRAPIWPVSSAAGMKSAGLTRRSPGRCQRTGLRSRPMTAARLRTGWYSRKNSSAAMAATPRALLDVEARPRAGSSRARPAPSCRPAVWRGAWHVGGAEQGGAIGAHARGSRPGRRRRAQPPRPATNGLVKVAPPLLPGLFHLRRTGNARQHGHELVPQPGQRGLGRQHAAPARRSATARKSASPNSWPRLSLTNSGPGRRTRRRRARLAQSGRRAAPCGVAVGQVN